MIRLYTRLLTTRLQWLQEIKDKISKSGIYSVVYIVSELTTRLHWLQLIKKKYQRFSELHI